MHHFYLQHPPSYKHLILGMLSVCYLCWRVGHPLLLSLPLRLLGRLLLIALVTVKCCSDLTLLYVDNQHLFLQHHAEGFIPLSGGKTDHLGHLPPQICIDSHANVNFCPVFYLKAYLRCTEPLRMKPDGLHITSLFLVTIGSTGLSVIKPLLLG